jgi:hypothetical protein
MHHDFLFETNRFNLSKVREHFINPCCFGEDLAAWLRDKLVERGMEVTKPDQEDWGWYIEARHGGSWYFVGIGGNADESGKGKDQGEWRLMVEKRRSVWEKLNRKNEMSETDEVMVIIREVLKKEPDFQKVRYENDAPNKSLKRTRQ